MEHLAHPPTASTSSTPDLQTKVENRLCSSKAAASEFKQMVAWVTGEVAELPKRKGVRQLGQESASKRGGGGASKLSNDARSKPDGTNEDLDEDDAEDMAAAEAGWESGSVSGAEFEGAESDDDDGRDDYATAAFNTRIAPDSSDDDDDTPVTKRPNATTSKTANDNKKYNLPKLASGFAYGDGDSDPDLDYDPTGNAGTKKLPKGKAPQERTNRRGQRARQA
jgi:hypothetical protein